MKKIIVSAVTASVLFAGLGVSNEAHAAESNINYLSSSIVKKAQEGKLSMDGFSIGKKASIFNKSSKYYKDGTREFSKQYISSYSTRQDCAFVDFQSTTPSTKRVITRIIDKDINDKRTIERGEIIGKYKEPIKSDVVVNRWNESKQVDMYKNITFFYKWDADEDKAPILDGVVIMHNKTKSAQQKWFDYATGEADYDVENMNDYITSSEWADL